MYNLLKNVELNLDQRANHIQKKVIKKNGKKDNTLKDQKTHTHTLAITVIKVSTN